MRVLWKDIFIVSVLCRCSPERFMARSVRLPLSNFQEREDRCRDLLGRIDTYIGKICLTDPLRDKLDVLTGVGMEPEVGNPVLIAEGVDGYRLTKSDLLKLNCITDGCEFYLDNDCILMRKIDPSANEKIDPAQLRIRTGNGMVEADGIPAGHRYALYNLSGIILAKGVSDGGTIRIPVSHSGIYIFQAAGVGKKIRVSE